MTIAHPIAWIVLHATLILAAIVLVAYLDRRGRGPRV